MKNKILLLTILFIIVTIGMKAQQLPQFSQYMLNELAINPAVTGKYDFVDVVSSNRYQWTGITDAPRTYYLTAHGPFKNKHMGLGFSLFTDIVGPTRREGANISYAYHITLSKEKDLKLSMGLYAGFLRWGIDGHKLKLHDDGDNNLLIQYQTVFLPDFGAGLSIYNKRGYFGVAVPQLYQSPIQLYVNGDNKSTLVSHVNVNGAYKFDIGEDFKLEPSFLVKYVSPVPLKIDGALRCIYKDQFWLGGSYRTNDAWSAMVGMLYKNYLLIGYSYDFTTTNLRKYNTGTHEIVLGMRLSKKQDKHWESEESKSSY